jgi:hypothetical protein
MIACELGWRLVDKELIDEISCRGEVTTSEAAALDERVDPWIHRLMRPVCGFGIDGVSAFVPLDVFDAEKAASLARQVIEEAYKAGECVIVGRASQCILQNREDVFHAFIYAGWEERVKRIAQRVGPGANVEELVRSMEEERIEYIRLRYKQNRMDPHLYDIMLDSKNQLEKAAELIIAAMRW